MTLALTSSAFAQHRPIPEEYTCDGENLSPPLTWSGVPAGTKSLALIVDDPDSPDPQSPQRTYVHWVLYNIPPTTTGLAEGGAPPPHGAREGVNDWKQVGYGGPCPSIGRHRYFFKLYALDTVLRDLGAPTKGELEAAMRDHILAYGELIGTYRRIVVAAY